MACRPKHENTTLFRKLAADLTKVRPHSLNTVCCPLCLVDFSEDEIGKLSVEHPIPSKLDGRVTTLTCRSCNNKQGARLDRNLVSAMKAIDGFEGLDTIDTVWKNDGGHVALDFLLRKGSKVEPVTMKIVGKASNPRAVSALPSQMFDGAKINLKFNLDFVPDKYWRAAMRAAYLAVFDVKGYEWVFSKGAEQARAIINGDGDAPQKLVMEAFPDREPPGSMLISAASFSDLGEYFAVLLRLTSKRTRYLLVFLPGKPGCDLELLGSLYAKAPQLRLETTPETWVSPLFIYLNYDPIDQIRRMNF
jgi:hypothetical protein